jgi:hypothetical protein
MRLLHQDNWRRQIHPIASAPATCKHLSCCEHITSQPLHVPLHLLLQNRGVLVLGVLLAWLAGHTAAAAAAGAVTCLLVSCWFPAQSSCSGSRQHKNSRANRSISKTRQLLPHPPNPGQRSGWQKVAVLLLLLHRGSLHG